jgi:hypothetical protein
MTTYTVYWTYVGNFADQPVQVEADNPDDAIEKAFPFYADNKDKVRFMVFEGKLVHQSMPFKIWGRGLEFREEFGPSIMIG